MIDGIAFSVVDRWHKVSGHDLGQVRQYYDSDYLCLKMVALTLEGPSEEPLESWQNGVASPETARKQSTHQVILEQG